MTRLDAASDVREWARTLHPYSPELQEDPHPYFARLRAECPVAHSDQSGGFWILSKYEDIRFVLQHHDLFSSTQITVDPMSFTPLGQDIPTQIDPPEHTRYRTLMNPWFSPRVVASMEDGMRAAAV
jgi:cytochrome P450